MNEKQKHIVRLLQTARGQMEGTIRMLEEGRYCIDVSNQLIAIEALIRKANAEVLNNHLRTCVRESIASDADSEQKLREVEQLLYKIAR